MRILPQAPRRTRPEGLDGGLQSPRRLDNQARICCTFVAFGRPGVVVDSSPVRAKRAKRPLCPAPFSIPNERAAPRVLPDEFVLPANP